MKCGALQFGVKAMLLWIESQNTVIIALLGFGFCYALAAIIFGAAVVLSQRPIAVDLKATSPVMLTPLSVIAALLIAFLASRVWANRPCQYRYRAGSQRAPRVRFARGRDAGRGTDRASRRCKDVSSICRDGRLASNGRRSRELT
jgi:hypothetical protein